MKGDQSEGVDERGGVMVHQSKGVGGWREGVRVRCHGQWCSKWGQPMGSIQEKDASHSQGSLTVSSCGSGWPPLSSCSSSRWQWLGPLLLPSRWCAGTSAHALLSHSWDLQS